MGPVTDGRIGPVTDGRIGPCADGAKFENCFCWGTCVRVGTGACGICVVGRITPTR